MTLALPRPKRLARAARALAAAAIWGGSAVAVAAPLDDLRRLVEAGQFEPAYATAQANAQLIGDVHFDFLYGVAAINTGHIPEGVLALERHLAAVPANDRARLELARGYFLLGEYTRARAEFEFVLRYNPPAGVRATITGYLDAMQVREAADSRANARFYAEAGFGHDSNVNAGTFRDELQLGFGTISLAGSPSQQVPDSFGQLSLGGEKNLRVTGRLSVFAGGDLDQRTNSTAHAYDLTTGSVYVGFTQLTESTLWRVTIGSSELQVGGNRYRDTFSVNTDANVPLGPELSASGFVQYGELRYAVVDESRDARSITLGGTLNRGFANLAWQPSVGLRASWTSEQNTRAFKANGYEMPLLRVFVAASPMEKVRVSLGLTALTQKYDGLDVGFGSVRHDHGVSLDLNASYTVDARWSVRAEGVWSRNRSNQVLYDRNRGSGALKLRYQY